ncbi:MAG: hypothetical protein JOZ18_16665 [Chloroflexi bacterium]|nr:hypothetical protein [Chloroflexota bacterium]
MQYSEKEERGYPWLFFHPSNQWMLSLLVSLVILAIGVGFFVWCTHVSDDMGGDSFAGLVLAVAATFFMFMAAVAFSLRRRSRQRSVGGLNAVLNWHVCFGTLALIFVFMHAFNNYNPRTGTYALYGMIALVISGFIGRFLDRMLPRIITRKVSTALTAQGEDRIESITRELQSIAVYNKQEIRGFDPNSAAPASSAPLRGATGGMKSASAATRSKGQQALQTPWDLAYISIDETPQEIGREAQYRFVPDRKSPLARPGALYPGAQEHISALEEVQHALKQEAFFRYVIRYWRMFHITLAVVTVAVTLWHIEYALSLVIPAIQKFGFNYLLPWP